MYGQASRRTQGLPSCRSWQLPGDSRKNRRLLAGIMGSLPCPSRNIHRIHAILLIPWHNRNFHGRNGLESTEFTPTSQLRGNAQPNPSRTWSLPSHVALSAAPLIRTAGPVLSCFSGAPSARGHRDHDRIAEEAMAVLGLGQERVAAGCQVQREAVGPDARAGLRAVAQKLLVAA